MLRFDRSAPVVVVALCSMLAFGATAQGPVAAPPSEPQSGTAGPDLTATNESVESLPVLTIASVEVLRSPHSPSLDIVVARGLTSSEGWTDAMLVPLTRGTPADGVLDMVLVAEPPPDAAGAAGRSPIQAVLLLAPDHPFKAIRVRGASNAVTLRGMPGFAEAKASATVCDPCVGKNFLAKGATAPAGIAADQIVREEDLPPNTRVVRPNGGISDMHADPNRLTLVLGDDGRILDAVWE
ncbi:MAG: hypothetical protein WB509_30675 [Acetobacteraceae bacterium]|jgi:hypothetical protein